MPSRRVALITLTAALSVGLVLGGGSAVLENYRNAAKGAGADQGGPIVQPSGGEGTATSGEQKPLRFRKVALDLRGSAEKPTSMPYWSHQEKAIVSGDRTLPVKGEPASVTPLAGGSYAVLVQTDDANFAMSLVDADSTRDLGPADPEGIAVSAGGERFVWTVGTGATLIVANARTGEIERKKGLPESVEGLAGFAGDRLVVELPEQRTAVYDPAAGSMDELPDADYTYATSPERGLVAVGTPKRCAEIRSGTDAKAKKLWSSCTLAPIRFSPDGRYAITEPIETDGAGATSTTVVDLETGRAVLELRADLVNQAVWSGESTVVIAAHSRDHFGLVTCTLDGKCVRASEAPEYAGPGSEMPLPYLLATT